MKVPSIPARAARRPVLRDERPNAALSGGDRLIAGYFQQLWWANIPLARVFWRDMAAVGTLVNVAAIGLAALLVTLGASTGVAITIFAAPIPYNIFLVVAVWRRADRERHEWTWPARIGSFVWLLIAFLI